jgi:hypothetical protein
VVVHAIGLGAVPGLFDAQSKRTVESEACTITRQRDLWTMARCVGAARQRRWEMFKWHVHLEMGAIAVVVLCGAVLGQLNLAALWR